MSDSESGYDILLSPDTKGLWSPPAKKDAEPTVETKCGPESFTVVRKRTEGSRTNSFVPFPTSPEDDVKVTALLDDPRSAIPIHTLVDNSLAAIEPEKVVKASQKTKKDDMVPDGSSTRGAPRLPPPTNTGRIPVRTPEQKPALELQGALSALQLVKDSKPVTLYQLLDAITARLELEGSKTSPAADNIPAVSRKTQTKPASDQSSELMDLSTRLRDLIDPPNHRSGPGPHFSLDELDAVVAAYKARATKRISILRSFVDADITGKELDEPGNNDAEADNTSTNSELDSPVSKITDESTPKDTVNPAAALKSYLEGNKLFTSLVSTAQPVTTVLHKGIITIIDNTYAVADQAHVLTKACLDKVFGVPNAIVNLDIDEFWFGFGVCFLLVHLFYWAVILAVLADGGFCGGVQGTRR